MPYMPNPREDKRPTPPRPRVDETPMSRTPRPAPRSSRGPRPEAMPRRASQENVSAKDMYRTLMDKQQSRPSPSASGRDQRAADNLNGGRMVYYPPEYRQHLYDLGLIDESFLDQAPKRLPFNPNERPELVPMKDVMLNALMRRMG